MVPNSLSPVPFISSRGRVLRNGALLATVSAVALLATAFDAAARPLGGSASAPSQAAIAAAQSASAEAAQTARAAQNALKRATQAVQAMQATQQAARDAAKAALAVTPSGIPHGLKPGGLEVAPGAVPGSELWQGAKLPSEAQEGDRTKVTVEQNQQKAILNWQTFNVSEKTDLYFDQRAGSANAREWIALNRVLDPGSSPSRILGSIKAEGQVYLINRNGIVFGGTSQVNVGTLVASSLSLSNEQFMAGINNPQKIADQAGNDYGLPQFGERASGGSYGTEFTPSHVPGEVRVERGAILKADSGGKLMLFAPKVTNAGHIEVADGQVILAAGEQVWLTSDLNGIRGLDVAASAPASRLFNYGDLIGAIGLGTNYGGFTDYVRDVILPTMEARAAAVGYNVSNTGTIHVDRGNITLQSRDVYQNGVLTATSALNNREGSIRLRAWGQGMMGYSSSLDTPQIAHWSSGLLMLGSESVTAVTPDLADTSEIEQSALATRYKPGFVQLRGELIDVRSNASVMVPSGTISVVAGSVPIGIVSSPARGPSEVPVDGDPTLKDGSRIYIDSGAYLTVAGIQDVLIPMARNFVEAQLYINELRDSPLYRDSWLRGLKVIVDRRESGIFESGPMSAVEWIADSPGKWVGTPLADLSAWIGIGKTDLAELSTKGGAIILKSGGSVITRTGAVLDVSGGSVRYTEGWNNATKLRGADGRIYDIANATPDMIYVGPAQGFSRNNARWGISQTWTSPLSKTAARFEKGYTEGRDAGSIQIAGGEALILDGSYWGGVIAGERQAATGKLAKAGTLKIGGGSDPDRPWTPADLIITDVLNVLPADFTATTPVSTDYYRPGTWPLPEKTSWLFAETLNQSGLGKLDLFVTNSFSLESRTRLDLSPGATLSVSSNGPVSRDIAFNIDGTVRIAGGTVSLGTAGAGLRAINLGANANIDVGGQWANELTNGLSAVAPMVNGGTINLSAATTNVVLGAVLDVSGGGWLTVRGGKVQLKTGDAGNITLPVIASDQMANLDLRAYAAGSGGGLSFETRSSVQLGSSAPVDASVLYVPGSLYAERGFRSVSITSYGDITVPDGAVISQVPVAVDLTGTDYAHYESGTKITDIGRVGVLPLQQRAARRPTELTLKAFAGDVTVGTGAVIRADLGGRIELVAGVQSTTGNLTVRGTIEAPAGAIILSAIEQLHLTNGASLLARGAPVIFIGAGGYRSGEVRSGGTVSLESPGLSLDKGSLIDVSGANGAIDVPNGGLGGRSVSTIQLASDGGLISIKGAGVIEGALVGRPGGPGAAGGRLLFDHAEAPGGGGATPGEVLLSQISWLDPTCYFDPYTCESNPQNVIGFDVGLILEMFGMGDMPEMILTRALIDRLSAQSRSELLLSESARHPGSSGALDPALYGLTQEALDAFRDYVFYSDFLRDSLKSPPTNSVLIVRPSSMTAGGFADLSFSSNDAIKLDGVSLSATRSIALEGPVFNANGLNSILRTSFIRLETFGAAAMSASTAGQLKLSGNLIEVVRAANIRGFAETLFETTDLRLSAPALQAGQTVARSALDVEGNLILKAAQVYPSSGVQATIKATGTITVERNGDVAPPLSAGGSLSLEAPVIEQNGVLRAPFGQITLKAGDRVALGAGSITSVSGAGLIIPFGTLSNGEHWLDPTKWADANNPTGSYLAAPPEKWVVLDAPSVNVGAGSTIDVRGGGDLYAREFVPGPGGSHDILAMPNAYAVLPGFSGYSPSAGASGIGDRVWLAGGNGLAAGWYTLLPASYAALPGAYLVTLSSDAQTTALARTVTLADGSVLMAGRRANALTGIEDAMSSTWQVMSGGQLRQYSEYNEAFANPYFSSDAFKLTRYRLTGQEIVTPRLPMDGGAVVFKATQDLILEGQLQSQAVAGGRGGLVDIAGAKIAIVGKGHDASALRQAAYLVIDAGQLTNFGAESLLVGGTRSGDPLGLRLDVTASDVVIANDESSTLSGPEIILAASGLIDIAAGSVISAKGEASAGAGNLVITPQIKAGDDPVVSPSRDFGALVRLSNGDPVKVIRENVDTSAGGIVSVGANAKLAGGNALLLDATRNSELAPSAELSGLALSVASGRISFGGGSDGLVLSSESLAQLAHAQHLTLRSYTTIDFHSSVALGGSGLAAVTLDAGGFVGHGANQIAVTGKTIVLENSGTASAGPLGVGLGSLTLMADELVLGAGSKTIGGFSSVVLAGRDRVVGVGNGKVDAGSAPLTISTPVLMGRGGAAQSIVTTGTLTITGDTASPLAGAESSLGSRFALTGGSVHVQGRIVALGGAIDLTATAGDVVLADGSLIDVGGFAKQFFDVTEYADAGRIALTAVDGDVRMSANAALNLSGDVAGGDAGKLSVMIAGGGTVVLDGHLTANAAAGGKGGSFALDIATLSDFSGLNSRLNDAGFFASRQFRVRAGDVLIDGLTRVDDFSLAADQGKVVIAGIVDARSTYGGRIAISGGGGIAMDSSAILLAGATDPTLGSGRVTLEASGGILDLRGGVIDVGGGEGGRVRLRAPQTAGHDEIAVTRLDTGIVGARSAVLEGVSIYDSGSVDAVKAQAVADASAFASHAAAIATRLANGDISIMPGIEIRSSGDLTVESDWNLLTDFARSREGSLTLRASGNLIVNGHISDGFDLVDRSGQLQNTASWDLRLIAGGDLTSASALTVKPLAAIPAGSGNLIVGDVTAGKLIRTGTGDIDVRVGRNLDLANNKSVIYTAGRRDMTTWADFTSTPANAAYGVQGGHLSIVAQGNITSALPMDNDDYQLFTEWLQRWGRVDAVGSFLNGQQTSWWINYGAFQQGVGALGGGNVAIDAGGDVVDLLVALPTNARVRGGRSPEEIKTLEMRNGGSMSVSAGGAIRGGQYYVGRGAGTITAGELTPSRTVSVLQTGGAWTISYDIAPVLALGDASLAVHAAGDLRVQTVLDPLMVDSERITSNRGDPFIFGYTDRTSLALVSSGGDVTLVNNNQVLFGNQDLADWPPRDRYASDAARAGNLYPAITHIAALSGNVLNERQFYTAPGKTADLRILADQDVFTGSVIMARGSGAWFPTAFRPGVALPGMFQVALNEDEIGRPLDNPDRLLLQDDYEPSRIYARLGSLVGVSSYYHRFREAAVVTNEQTWFRAGRDIRGIDYTLRNIHETDVSLLEAGNDIIAATATYAGGIKIEGPGSILLSAGRDVYAGGVPDGFGGIASFSVISLGNRLFDSNNRPVLDTDVRGLPEDSAAITVMAGLKGKRPSYARFQTAYLDPANVGAMPDYLKTKLPDGSVIPIYLIDLSETNNAGEVKTVRRGLVSFIAEMTGETLSPLEAWARFASLPKLTQEVFLRRVYMQEIRDAGRDQNEPGEGGLPLNGGYNRGYAAVESLFPGTDWKGDVVAHNLTLRTMAGGDIGVLTPGGGLQVAALGAVVPAGNGLITLGAGHINIFTRDDVTVNRSRILTFVPEAASRGSDMIIWSTLGDIDAGRGAKTVRVPSAPDILTDPDGNTAILERNDVGGSGIGTVGDGDVDLIAPKGTVNAGDAGIRVAGNLNLAALFVANVGNIEVRGDSKGLPPAPKDTAVGALTLQDNSRNTATDAAKDAAQAPSRQPSIIIVEVLGFGGGAGDAPDTNDEERRDRRSDHLRQDPNSAIQVIGAGALSAEQRQKLTVTERRNFDRP